jgi:hypothetical protein
VVHGVTQPVAAHPDVSQVCGVAIVHAPLPSQVVVGVKVLLSLLQVPVAHM